MSNHLSIEEIKRKAIPIAEKYNLKDLYLYGSYARGDADIDSDLDLMADTDGSKATGLKFISCILDFEDAFNRKVDLTPFYVIKNPDDEISRKFASIVMSERIKLYER
ncbi:MAG: nucleotidyltransferase [Clostridiaceae bacterium]|nr:nucleotidyltransferase [Clostridiaceae bacterium]